MLPAVFHVIARLCKLRTGGCAVHLSQFDTVPIRRYRRVGVRHRRRLPEILTIN